MSRHVKGKKRRLTLSEFWISRGHPPFGPKARNAGGRKSETISDEPMDAAVSGTWQTLDGRAPQAPAVYALFDPNGELLYVGYSYRLRDRLESHPVCRRWTVTKIKFRECVSAREACRRERRLILRLKPKLNATGRHLISNPYRVGPDRFHANLPGGAA